MEIIESGDKELELDVEEEEKEYVISREPRYKKRLGFCVLQPKSLWPP